MSRSAAGMRAARQRRSTPRQRRSARPGACSPGFSSDGLQRYGFSYRCDDLFLHARVDPGPQRKRKVLARGALGLGEIALGVTEIAKRGLQVQRCLVVGRRGDLGRPEVLRDPIPLRRADDIHVVDVAWLVARQLADLAEAEFLVPGGSISARPVPLLEV